MHDTMQFSDETGLFYLNESMKKDKN